MSGSGKTPSIRMVWGIAKSPELKMTDEELHLVVQAHTGKDSIKALTARELRTVVNVLVGMKESCRREERGKKYQGGSSATVNQRRKIYMLQKELGWDSDPKRLSGFCRRMFRVDRVEWLDYRQCSDLIEALKAMVKKQEQGAAQEVDADGGLPCRADG